MGFAGMGGLTLPPNSQKPECTSVCRFPTPYFEQFLTPHQQAHNQ
jgi:hypothetical protein